jgi:hypothetical protein
MKAPECQAILGSGRGTLGSDFVNQIVAFQYRDLGKWGRGSVELRPHQQTSPGQWQEGGVSRGMCLYEDMWRFDPTCGYRISENYPHEAVHSGCCATFAPSSSRSVLALSELL